MKKKAMIIPLSGGSVKFMDACLEMLRAIRLDPGIRRLADMNIDKPCSFAKIQRELGWEPAYSLEQSIRDSFSAGKT